MDLQSTHAGGLDSKIQGSWALVIGTLEVSAGQPIRHQAAGQAAAITSLVLAVCGLPSLPSTREPDQNVGSHRSPDSTWDKSM